MRIAVLARARAAVGAGPRGRAGGFAAAPGVLAFGLFEPAGGGGA